MDTLFSIEPNFPPGFSYKENFISSEEENELIQLISNLNLEVFIFRGFEAKRKVASFGYDYHFNDKSISKGTPIPEGFNFLIERVAHHLKIKPDEFAELLVIEYPVDSVMNWHRDAAPFGIIAGISLLTDCKFKLRPYDKSKQTKNAVVAFPVRKRSLYVMTDEVRNDWEHSVNKVKQVRYSITLRTMKEKANHN